MTPGAMLSALPPELLISGACAVSAFGLLGIAHMLLTGRLCALPAVRWLGAGCLIGACGLAVGASWYAVSLAFAVGAG